MTVDSKDKPIGHLAYSTTDLAAVKARIMSLGIAIAEDISIIARSATTMQRERDASS